MRICIRGPWPVLRNGLSPVVRLRQFRWWRRYVAWTYVIARRKFSSTGWIASTGEVIDRERGHFAAHPLDLVPSNLMPSRDTTGAALDALAVQGHVGTDAFNEK